MEWFGSAVRRRRVADGKSLETLGAEVYLSRAYLGKIERGDARGNYQQALALDNALGADGSLARLFLEECARVGPTAPDTGILTQDEPGPRTTESDPEELPTSSSSTTTRSRAQRPQPGRSGWRRCSTRNCWGGPRRRPGTTT